MKKTINLSHVSTTSNIKILSSPAVKPPAAEETADGGIQEDGRLRPNSTFLRRYVGGVEKSNEKLPIVAPALETSVNGNESENKANVIQELKGR
jgi:hypothetical protein